MTFKIGPNGEILPESPLSGLSLLNDRLYNEVFTAQERPLPPTPVSEHTRLAPGTTSVAFDSPQLDKIMSGNLPNGSLRITGLPKGAEVNYWVDQNGFFLWFDGTGTPFKPHYIGKDLHIVEWNDQRNDMAATRTKTRDQYMAKHGQPLSSFYESLGQNTDTLGYAWNMSQLAKDTLAKEEAFLSQAAKDSKNPYLNLFLCDVYIAQSMQPLIEQFKNHQPLDLKNPETTAKLNAALEQAQIAQNLSNNSLHGRSFYPPGNVIMPLYPFYNPDEPYAYQYFWGGSLCQAQQRELAIRYFQNLIKTGSLSSLLHKWEMP